MAKAVLDELATDHPKRHFTIGIFETSPRSACLGTVISARRGPPAKSRPSFLALVLMGP